MLAFFYVLVLANQLANEAIAEATALCSNERLAFHEKCGALVRLTNKNQTAERQRPNGEFNNGVVMTNRPLKPDELFEVCTLSIDKKVFIYVSFCRW